MNWINVETNLPEKYKMVLCNCNRYESLMHKDRKFIDFNIPVISWMLDSPFNCFDIEHKGYFKVTHWMILPEPPM
jgi:hypothetical protein